MKCPKCGTNGARVVDSRPTDGGSALRRRRLCESCDYRYTTLERAVAPLIYVIKKDGRREEFDAVKLRQGVVRACNKRPVSMDDIDRMIGRVESDLHESFQRQDGKKEVEAAEIGALVMQHLYALDQVAYVRFASVYQRFDDVKLFAQLLERIARGGRRPRQNEIQQSENQERHQENQTTGADKFSVADAPTKATEN